MTIEQLKELALHAAKGTAPATFSVENVNDAFIDGLKELAGNYYDFMQNRYTVYQIMTETIDEVVPAKVADALGIFAEVRTVGDGEQVVFKRRIGKERAKKFLTRVGLSGVYETFRLDNESFTVPAFAIGGACMVDFDRMLDGAENMAELMDIMTEGLTDAIYLEVQKALQGALSAQGRPAANKVVGSWNADQMQRLCNVVKAYGGGATIFAPPEFVAAMGPDAIVPVGTNYQGIYHPQDIDAIHYQGYINIFRGTPIVQFRQSFIDENNDKVWIDPQLAYVLPTGGERVVKVVLEGATRVMDWQNKDRSMEIHFDKKVGTAILTHHNWGIYQNTAITTPVAGNPYGI
ncbi:MAG: hypothetical protein IKU01_01680 [Bacteroidales bacterium]|nr:hypothetical protein [Bacteroidales bacterium]